MPSFDYLGKFVLEERECVRYLIESCAFIIHRRCPYFQRKMSCSQINIF